MIPYFVFDHFNIGPLRFYTWGFFVGLAFSAGYLWILWQGRKQEVPLEKIIGLALAIFLGTALGSRLLFLLQAPKEFLADVSLLWRINQGGLMLWGGILGAILFSWLYIKYSHGRIRIAEAQGAEARFSHANFWKIADLATPAIALGIIIGRIGCFLVNDHAGAPTTLPWGILWPDGISRHPVALYESLAAFGLFFVFWWLQRRAESRRRSRLEAAAPPNPSVIPATEPGSRILDSRFRGNDKLGQLFLIFLISYSIIRFFLDFFRESQGILADPRWWGLTTSQWISLVLVFLSFMAYSFRKRNTIVP